ncbi:MAG: hypothetical protein Q4A42_03010 [Tissierellia bacterium]|nr:hypothetical protein [Tissierellia bacterium]
MIIVNGRNCSELNIVFNELPSIPKPVRRTEERIVSGRDGTLTIDKGTYDNISLTLTGHAECTRSELIAYFGNFGELKFETSADRFWKYRVVNLDIREILDDGELLSFGITLSFSPYKYLDSGKEKIFGTSMSLANNYNSDAYPILRIYASGDIGITKNLVQVMRITGVEDYVIVDCEADVIHRDNVNYDSRVTGDVFFLDSNKTTILNFSGGVSKVELIPNWREI